MAVGYAGYASYGTPEAIEKKRRIAEQLAMAGLGRAPKDVGEGLNAIGQALIARSMMDEITGAETSGRKSAADAFSSLFGGSGTADVSSGAGGVSTPVDYASQRVAQAHAGGSGVLPPTFTAAIDKSEGGGGYDTLFSFANRDGPFAGVDVSKMSIGDVMAFTDPSGPYAQYVKGKIGRVATPVGRHQIVGTTLRNSVEQLGLDPSMPFDAKAQDTIAMHLARKRVQSADTMPGKIAALRSEWEGFKSVPDAQLAQIVAEIEGSPANVSQPVQVASLDPSAGVAEATGGAVPPEYQITPEAWARMNAPDGAVPASGKGPRITPVQAAPDAGMGAPGTPVTQTDEGRRALAAMLSGQPMTGGAPMPMQGAPAAPQVSPAQQQIAQQLTNLPVMAGGNADALSPQQAAQAGSFPAAPPQPQARAQMGQGGQPSIQQIMQVMSNPWLSDSQKQIAAALLEQELQSQDPMRKLQMEKAQLEIEQARNPQRELINAGKGRLYNPNTGQWITAPDMGTDAPTVQSFYDDKGQEYKAQWDAQKRDWVPVGGSKLPSGGVTVTSPDGTTMTLGGAGQKLTEGQGKDIVYYTQGTDANTRLGDLEGSLTDFMQKNAGSLPLGVGNYLRTPEFRQASAAAERFLSAVLRKETGAAVTDTEWERYGPMFLPVPGDDSGTIQQKRRAREVALLAIRSGLGTADSIAAANRIILGLDGKEGQLTPQPSKQPAVIDGYTIEEVE